jgi:prophage regulatory protein
MSRLPAKTKGPIGVHSSNRALAIDDADVTPETDGQAGAVAQPADRARSLKLLRFPAVRDRTGLSRSTIWRLEREGDFPKHRRISANAVAWVEEEVLSWIHSKVGEIAV